MSSKDILVKHLVGQHKPARSLPSTLSKRELSHKHAEFHAEGADHRHPKYGSPSERLGTLDAAPEAQPDEGEQS